MPLFDWRKTMARTRYPFKVNNVDIPCPSKCDIGYQDVSAPDSGRTLDAQMWKNRVSQKVKLDLEWLGVSDEDAATILQAFDPEYFNITYRDAKTNSIVTKNFYAGDRKATTYWWSDDDEMTFSNITLNVIER